MANRFFTILVIPEKTSSVKRVVVPSWLLKGSFIGMIFLGGLGLMMLVDYWYVMNQIDETKELKIENRRLIQQVQIFKNKMKTVDNTMERIRTFSTRLKVITNIEDRDGIVKRLNEKLPEAISNIGNRPLNTSSQETTLETQPSQETAEKSQTDPTPLQSSFSAPSEDPENIRLKQDQKELDDQFALLNHDSLLVEQELQDLYELLIDQKSFLAALPTRKPTVGYFTSGFGIRKSPYGGRETMHEGLDIANHHGTLIRATAYGMVKFSGRKPGYGRTVILDHGYGLETWYAHSRKTLVRKGDRVRRGQKIALMGSSGRSTGPHVHYEVRVHGIPVDPLSYILEE